MMTGHIFAPQILREYDIRGRVGDTLSPQDGYALGHAFVAFLGQKTPNICVGYDGRTHSPMLAQALMQGLREAGAHVTCIGLGPTPMLYFAVHHTGADAGIMVTGSHNPPQDNGFKLMRRQGPIFGADIQKIGEIAKCGLLTLPLDCDCLPPKEQRVDTAYIARLLQDLTLTRALKVAWDAGNGAVGDVLQAFVRHLPGEHILLYADIDGTFPNHHPDPTVDENMEDLQRVVREQGCDVGIAFDGDGDRIGVVDGTGAIVRGDRLMILYARDVLKTHKGAPIIADVKCSDVLFEEITRAGGQAIMGRTGHSLIKAKMAELHSPLAGEFSGHIFFADRYYGYDDALYCAVRLLNIIGDQGSLADLLAHVRPLYSTPEIRLQVPEVDKFAIVGRVAANLTEAADVCTIDGVRVTMSDGWWLLRASNTGAALVARAESSTPEGLARLHSTLMRALDAVR